MTLINPREELKFPSPAFAVFNLHVNNAGARALAICRQLFSGDDPEMMSLEKDYEYGIMRILRFHMTRPEVAFAALCFTFANDLDRQ